jgi:hypothetical protein
MGVIRVLHVLPLPSLVLLLLLLLLAHSCCVHQGPCLAVAAWPLQTGTLLALLDV